MKPDQVRILKMEGHAKILHGYLEMCVDFSNYSANEPIRSASVLHLLQIGELANNLSPGFHARHPNIPWKSIIGLRNIVAHRYGDLNYSRIWEIIESELPGLLKWLESKPS